VVSLGEEAMDQQGLVASEWQVFSIGISSLGGSFGILFLFFFYFSYVLDFIPVNLFFHI
jgi:hypothetical protein